MILLLTSIVFLLLYAMLIHYYAKGWRSLGGKTNTPQAATFISVIVPARNEENNIPALLRAISEQTYPRELFELIIVDDFSTDSTAKLVREYSRENTRLIQPGADPIHSSKKKAIEAGINIARGPLIVHTDADCIPGPEWLRCINDLYSQTNASFIAAPVRFSVDGSLLQVFQAIDFLTLQGITAASVATNFHTMCNGANLAYRKQSFIEVRGYEGIDHVASGDDMLLMYKIWKKDPSAVHYLRDKNAIVTTTPMKSLKAFLQQRKRWASKTLVYDDYSIIAVLAFVYLLNCLFLVLIVAAFFNPVYWWYAAGYLAGKTIIEYPFVKMVAAFYEQEKLLRYFFFFQPFHILYTVYTGLTSQFGKYEWKGRKTK